MPGAEEDMSQSVSIDELFAFTRYLSWADLQGALFEEELSRNLDHSDPGAMTEHKRRWFGLMSYWYASLNVVIEAWEELKLRDPILDQLLAASNMRHMLQRYRNAVMHFQSTVTSPKFLELLREGEAHVVWIQALHQEFVRFLLDYFEDLVEATEQKAELRSEIERIICWFPYRHHPKVDALERTLARAREMLSQHPEDGSEPRRELASTVEACELFAHSPRGLEELRDEILHKAGIK